MYIGDLHIHSRYSRATSRDCTPEFLDLWARKKGIDLIGTGDFTHPAWMEELKEKLEPAQDGLYVLKKEYRIEEEGAAGRTPRFVVTGEISSIYKKGERVRKVHSLLILPGLEQAQALAGRLALIGNIHSDGRPILGIPCRDLLEIMLETCPEGIYVPAHIWTPHFSLFGAFSGFDAIEECFEDLTPHIHALETGLSSDPPMIWRVGVLDRFQLISNSDAHSPAKLGREANLLDIEMSYEGLAGAIQEGRGLAGTIEFFPEEGKYHFDGHRKCGLCISPQETMRYGNKCPVCGKKITIGVLNRIEQLADADREEGFVLPSGRPFESLVPLPEVIGASMGISSAGKKAAQKYESMLKALGPEFSILREIPIEDIRKAAGPLMAEGIDRLRRGEVERTPGFDGEYGRIGLLSDEDISRLQGQMSFFTKEELQEAEKGRKLTDPQADTDLSGAESGQKEKSGERPEAEQKPAGQQEEPSRGLNERQREAVETASRAVAVIAGPGAGKTRTLIARLNYLLEERKISPEEITAVTFTNKAAQEMRERMTGQGHGAKSRRKAEGSGVWIGTFHAICSRFLQEAGISFVVADEGLQTELARKALGEFEKKDSPARFLRELSRVKNGLTQKPGGEEESSDDRQEKGAGETNRRVYEYYQRLLREAGALDYDDLLLETLRLLEKMPKEAPCRRRFSFLLIDEFQDINPLQYRLMTQWGQDGRELFVIGDPDQSIYGFRGCDPKVFARLSGEYPELVTIRLEENYRSAPAILRSALSVISHNEGEERRMQAKGRGVLPVRIVSTEDERREAIFICKEIARQIGGIDMLDTDENGAGEERAVRGFSDIAVLYRTHRQAALLEKCLRQEGIPYVVAGREDFLTHRQVRSALYFFRYLVHDREEAEEKLCRRLLDPLLGEAKEECFSQLADKYRKKLKKTRPVKLLTQWADEFSLQNEEAMKKLADMSVLYPDMEDFLHTLVFGEDGDVKRSGGRKFTADAVTLMTLHGSKGLEFPVVFLHGMDKGRLPLEFGDRNADLEEERRLCYVGMTRAKEELILVCGEESSRFLEELPQEGIRHERAQKTQDEPRAVQMSLFDIMGKS